MAARRLTVEPRRPGAGPPPGRGGDAAPAPGVAGESGVPGVAGESGILPDAGDSRGVDTSRSIAAPSGRREEDATGYLAIDRLFLAYIVVTGAYAAVTGRGAGFLTAGLHALAAGGVVWLARRPAPRRRPLRFLRVAYPVALTPFLYGELARLNQFLFQGYFDAAVQRWEGAVFGSQLAMEAAIRLPGLWGSEFLHLGYVSYYLIIPTTLVGVFLTRGAGATHRVAFATALAFFLSYVCFVVFPVAGPRYAFPAIGGEIAAGAIHDVVHRILEAGSSKGTAFPSSHVAAAGAAILAAWHEDRRWFWFLLLPWIALTLGTVYGRFHYGVDAAAGVALAAAVHWAAPGLRRRLARGRAGH